jgi:hypothetical protein
MPGILCSQEPAMNDVTNEPTSRYASTRPPRRFRWWFVLVAAGGLLVVGYLSTRIFGWVSGEEFSPDSFQRRRFSYYEIPLIHLQITPVSRESSTNPLENHLATDMLGQSAVEPRWDLVWARQGAQSPEFGDASILCAYLDARDSNGDLFWKTWTEKNPQLAKKLWTTVLELAQQQLYLLVPDVFALAAQATDAASLEQNIGQLLADRYELLARTQVQRGNAQLARQLAEEGLRYAPQRRSLQELLNPPK